MVLAMVYHRAKWRESTIRGRSYIMNSKFNHRPHGPHRQEEKDRKERVREGRGRPDITSIFMKFRNVIAEFHKKVKK
ncbi:hypothetical protein FACS189450_08200 [Spirochaetia bacterium]|nr:hypothetical protein FACS189450_08200 [Spirochaetia bacterium]